MLGAAMMRVAESGRFAERRQLISHFTTVLLECEARRGFKPPFSDEAVKRLAAHAAKIVDAIESEARQ